MSTPFDHMPEFQTLDASTKDQIMKKFQTLPQEDQQTVMKKANTPMQLRASEGIEETQGPITGALTLGVGGVQAGAEGLPVALRVGKNIVESPQRTIEAATSLSKLALQGVKSLGGDIGNAVAAGGDSLSGAIDAIKGTGAKNVASVNEKIAEAPIKYAAKTELAKTVLKSAGSDIGAAENAMKIDQGNTSTEAIRLITKSPDNITKFADRAGALADKGPDVLAKSASPETLQFYRKAAQSAIDASGDSLPPIAKNKLYNINKVFGDAIAKTDEGIKAGYDVAMSKYSDAMKVINELPQQFAAQKRALKLALVHAQNLANAQAPIRKAVGWSAAAGAVTGAAGLIKKELGQ